MSEKINKYPVVILPGWLLPAIIYADVEKELQEHGLTTFTIDFPGFKNRSLTQALDLTDYVKFLHKFLKTKKITQAIFIAHSFGGRVALKFLSQNPKKGKVLIISGTPGFPEVGNWRLILIKLIARFGKPITFVPPFLFFRKKLRHLFYRLNRSSDYLKVTGELKITFQNIIKEQLLNYMQKIRTPTLLLWGEKDRLVSVKTARKMQQMINNSQLEIVPDAGHMFIYKYPQIAAEKIVNFIKINLS